MITRFHLIIIVLFILPFLAFIGFGGYWLWEQNWLYQAIGILSANSVLIYTLLRQRNKRIKSANVKFNPIQPNPNWTDEGKLAFEALESVTEHWKNESDFLTNSKKSLQLTNDILTTVAHHFHKDSEYPILEFPLPYLLKLITLVCNDIQSEVLDKTPGSHAITISDLMRVKNTVDKVNNVKPIFDAGRLLFNWPGFALSTARGMLIDQGVGYVRNEISQRLVSVYVRKLGYYAIQLYSGQLTLDDIVPTDVLTKNSKNDIESSASNSKPVEPLRILVLGQVSSGKSSLINALFGEVKSAVSILPTTSEVTPYVLEKDGVQQAIILDSSGYAGLTHNVIPDNMKKEWARIDIIFMVCNASSAARNADVEYLNAIRQYFQQEIKDQELPVIIAIATHIDRLRPIQEWQPPYNIQNPDTPKEQNIRAFCESVHSDLNVPLVNILPVCLDSDIGIYNIDDGLMPMIHERLNDAQRVRYLRCLRQQQNKSYWKQWRKQALGIGHVFF